MKSSASMVKIDPAKVKRFLRANRMTQEEFGKKICYSQAAFSSALRRGTVRKSTLKLMCVTFGVPTSTFTPDPEPANKTAQAGYSLSLEVKPDKVRVAVLFDGKEIHSAFYRVTDNTETSLLRAISCATHICYEMAQQAELKGE